MNIALYSPNFHPLTGGLEHVVMDLATEFSRKGHTVTLITLTAAAMPDDFPFQVLRNPGFFRQVKAMRRADVVVQFNVSLKGIIPWLLTGRPLVVSHQTANRPDWRGRLKAWVANHLAALNIGCSAYMSRQFNRATNIPNPYNDELFRLLIPWQQRKDDLVFVGRLVSDKGADILLHALSKLQSAQLFPNLTIVGAGPQEAKLRQLVRQLDLDRQVAFSGLQKGEALVQTINRHRIMVVPSVWEEPFGIVALEGLACGCLVIGSDGGGLAEAIGNLGLSFPNKHIEALADRLQAALTSPERLLPHPKALAIHLGQHQRSVVAERYLQMLETITGNQAYAGNDSTEPGH